MERKRELRRPLAIFCLMASLLLCLAGCGAGQPTQEELLADMKEFSLPDGSVSIYLNKDWVAQDSGMANMLTVSSEKGDQAVILFQFAKDTYQAENLDGVREILEASYGMSNPKSVKGFSVPGLTNVSAFRDKINVEGISRDAYFVYGESDYAFYAICYVSSRWSNTTTRSFQASCSAFTETPL